MLNFNAKPRNREECSHNGGIPRGEGKRQRMAQLDIPIAQKKCATCRWWSGARKLIFVGADPKFVRIGGVLPAVGCRAWDGRKFGGAMTCFRWSKWEKL